MIFDIFFSICQTEVDGYTPSERQMFLNFFDQVIWADHLGYRTAWVAETHLSCQIQKENPSSVIPHFKGEIGLNSDIFQLAHLIFARTKKIQVGSAICNLLCNGGPVARAEAVRTFLSLHSLNANEQRRLEFGFAAGRFPFSNRAYGIKPRNELESLVWDVLKHKVFAQATEMFLRFVKGERFAAKDVEPLMVFEKDFRDPSVWKTIAAMKGGFLNEIYFPPFYDFEKVGVIPFESPLELLQLTIGSHDPELQNRANTILPVGVFNLSITAPEVIEETHVRMHQKYHPLGGPWQREMMPRTALIFLNKDSEVAQQKAEQAWRNYWLAMEKTLDPQKVEKAVSNAIAGNPKEVAEQIRQKFHPRDRLMLWFDFNNHNNEEVKASMKLFMENVAPLLQV